MGQRRADTPPDLGRLLLAHLTQHGPRTSNQLSTELGVERDIISARLSQMTAGGALARDRCKPVVTRTGRGSGGGIAYQYRVADPNASLYKRKPKEPPKDEVAKYSTPLITNRAELLADQERSQLVERPIQAPEPTVEMIIDLLDGLTPEWGSRVVASTYPDVPAETLERLKAQAAQRMTLSAEGIHRAPSPNGTPTLDQVLSDPTPVMPPVKVQPAAPQGLTEAVAEAVRVLSEGVANALVSQVSEAVAARVSAMIPALEAEIAKLPQPSVAELAARIAGSTKPEPKKEQLRTITIIGLKPQQAGAIQQEFNDCFNLHFWRDENYHRLSDYAKASDLCLAIMEACDHSSVATVKNAGCKLERISGGSTTIRNRLMELYAETPPPH